MPADITSITPTGYKAETESNGKQYEYWVSVDEEPQYDDDGELAEEGKAHVSKRIVRDPGTGAVETEHDATATEAVKEAMAEKDYHCT